MPPRLPSSGKHKRFTHIADFGYDLKGLGGLQTSRIRALRGSTFGAANPGRRLTLKECKALEEQMRAEGKL